MRGAMAGQLSMTLRRGLIQSGLFAATAAGLAAAIGGVTAGYSADAELGRHLASECMTCHRSATATSTIPDIFGLGEAHFVEVIKAYRNRALSNPVMQTVASRLNDDDIAALALYFATAKKPK